jgi:short-subunit dehydrogenase
MEIKNKVVIVTGASGGIGLATAQLLTKSGAKVALVARSRDKLENLARELTHSFVVVADMSRENEIKAMVQKVYRHYGRIDILVNNAGQGYDASIEKIKTGTYGKIFKLDVVGPLIAMQAVIPIMKKQGSGAIMNVSSGTALMSLANMGAYSSLKRALTGLSLTAREEMKDDNISVSVIYPYITLTDFEKNTIKEETGDGQEEYNADIPAPDTAEFVAQKILAGLQSGDAEIFVHDWMQNHD